MSSKTPDVSTTALKALNVLEIVADSTGPLTLSDVAARVGFDRSTTYRLLNTFVEAGYLLRDEMSKQYRLSYKLITLSRHLLADNEVTRASQEILSWLAGQTGETVHLSILDGMQTVLIQKVKGTQLVAVDFQIGDRSMLHCTSIGKVILAFQDTRFIEQVMAAGLPRFAANTITDPAKLRQELRQIQSVGYALDDHEFSDNMRCVAVPVFSTNGQVQMGISMSGPDSRFSMEKLQELTEPLLHSARELSARLGGTPWNHTT